MLTAWPILRAKRGTFMSEGLSPSTVTLRLVSVLTGVRDPGVPSLSSASLFSVHPKDLVWVSLIVVRNRTSVRDRLE